MNLVSSVKVSVTVVGFMDSILLSYPVEGFAMTPAASTLFDIRDPSAPGNCIATSAEQNLFHSTVAGCLYLVKTRPELKATVSFLATRVTKCDLDDFKKLQRMLRYIQRTRTQGMRLRPGASMEVSLWDSAFYGVNVDGKSHTGSAIVLGDGGVLHGKD